MAEVCDDCSQFTVWVRFTVQKSSDWALETVCLVWANAAGGRRILSQGEEIASLFLLEHMYLLIEGIFTGGSGGQIEIRSTQDPTAWLWTCSLLRLCLI